MKLIAGVLMCQLILSISSHPTTKITEEWLQPRDLPFGLLDTNENHNDQENLQQTQPYIRILSKIPPPAETESFNDVFEVLNEETNQADKEEREETLSLAETLKKKLLSEPARYAQILINNTWHTVDMGIFGSFERTKNMITTENFITRLSRLIWEIISLCVHFFYQENPEDKKKPENTIPGEHHEKHELSRPSEENSKTQESSEHEKHEHSDPSEQNSKTQKSSKHKKHENSDPSEKNSKTQKSSKHEKHEHLDPSKENFKLQEFSEHQISSHIEQESKKSHLQDDTSQKQVETSPPPVTMVSEDKHHAPTTPTSSPSNNTI